MRSKMNFRSPPQRDSYRPQSKYCILCCTANRQGYNTHYFSQCRFLPEADRRHMSKIHQIDTLPANDNDAAYCPKQLH